jgi:hypothetical protein
MLVAALSALVLQVAPAQYSATFSCDCRPHSAETSGTLTANPKPNDDFDVDYPKAGTQHLDSALRAGRRVIMDSSGLQLSSKWQSSVNVPIEDQTFIVPVSAYVISVDNGVVTVEARGELNDASVRLTFGVVTVSIGFDIVEHIKLGSSAGDAPVLTSLVETINDHYPRGAYGQPVDATVKCTLVAK